MDSYMGIFRQQNVNNFQANAIFHRNNFSFLYKAIYKIALLHSLPFTKGGK